MPADKNLMPIVLHQWEASPFCRKVARVLAHKNLPFTVQNYNGLRGAMAVRLSKVGKLPVLDVLGERVQDSTRIARFLDKHFPESPVYPTDAQERAVAELWEDWADEVLYWFEIQYRVMDPVALDKFVRLMCEGRPAAERAPIKMLLKFGGSVSIKAQGLGRMSNEAIDEEFRRHLDRIEQVLAVNEWLVGGAKTIADISVGSQLLEVVRTSHMRSEIESRPHLAAWIQKI